MPPELLRTHELVVKDPAMALAEINGASSVDENIQQSLKDGPSSLIADSLQRAINVAATEKSIGVLQLISNLSAAKETFSAFTEEAQAKAEAKRTIAQTALSTVRVAGADVRKDVVLAMIRSLEKSYREFLPLYCEEYGWELPRPNTIAEVNTLMKIHGLISGVERYRTELLGRMEAFAVQRARLESELEILKKDNELLPKIFNERQDSNHNRKRLALQKVGYLGAHVTGIPVAIATGAVLGIAEGVLVASGKDREIFAIAIKDRLSSISDFAGDMGRGIGSAISGGWGWIWRRR